MATEKTFQSELPALLQMFGTKTKTSGGTTTTTGSANTGPLQQVFDTAMKPMDQQLYDNLIASIFQKAGQQVPTLTAALANATGGRSSGNSALSLALNEQNNQAAQAAAQAILTQQNTQQQTAGNAASGIAQATRSTTATTPSSKQTVGPAVNPMLMSGLGFLANQADKRGWFNKLGGMFGGEETGATMSPISANTIDWDSAGQFGGAPTVSNFLSPSAAGTFGASGGGIDFSGLMGGAGNLFDGFDLNSQDFGIVGFDSFSGAGTDSNMADWGFDWLDSGVGSSLSGVEYDFDGSFADSLFSPREFDLGFGFEEEIPNFFDVTSLFADGGTVGGSNTAPRPIKLQLVDSKGAVIGTYSNRTDANIARNRLDTPQGSNGYRIIRGYADGGMVKPQGYADGGRTIPRNFANMGAPAPRTGMAALNGAGPGSQGLSSDRLMQILIDQMQGTQSGRPRPGPSMPSSPVPSGDTNTRDDPMSAAGEEALAFDAANGFQGRSEMLGMFGKMALGLMAAGALNPVAAQALSLAGVTKSPIAGAAGLLKNATKQQARQAGDAALESSAPRGGSVETNPATGGQYSVGPQTDILGAPVNANMSIDPNAKMSLDLSGWLGTAPAGGGGGSNSGGGAPMGGNAGLGGNSVAFADGGITGPGTDTVPATSKVPGGGKVMFTPGEIVIPVDTVQTMGEAFFHRLIEATHKPIRR